MKKKIWKYVGLGAGCLFIAAVLLEVIMEQLYGVPGTAAVTRAIPIRENLPGTELTASRDDYYNGIYGVTGVFEGLGTYHAKIDLNGFIEPSERYEEPDRTILFLGGSTTECITVSDEKRYPYLAGLKLEEETGYDINSYNAGVGGGNSHNSIDTLLHKGIRLNPDIAVLHHNINDLILLLKHHDYCYTQNDESFDFYYMQTAGTQPAAGGMKSRMNQILYQAFPAIYSRIQSAKPTGDVSAPLGSTKAEYDKESIMDTFQKNLNLFISICEINDITPVLMTQASRMEETPDELVAELYEVCGGYDLGLNYEEFYSLFEQMNDVIRDTAASEQVLCVDLNRNIEHTPENFYDMVHYTDAGSEKAADLIADALKKIVK